MSLWQRLRNHLIPHHTNAYRPHLLRRGWMAFFLAAVLMTEGFLVASLVGGGTSYLAAVVQSQVIALTNTERAQNHVGNLAENTLLDAAAQAKADDMAAKGYFSHTSPDGRQPWDFIAKAGYDYQYAGENLAVRFNDSADVMNAWMASPSHRANIVKAQYTEIGVATAEGMYKGAPATFVVQYFGAPTATFAAKERVAHGDAAASGQGQVLGAEVGPAPAKVIDSAVRQLPRLADNPQGLAAWVLGGIATLLVLVLGLTVLMHIRIQPTDLLLPGVAVAGIAVFLLAFNATIFGAVGGQSASAVMSDTPGVVIGADAAATAR